MIKVGEVKEIYEMKGAGRSTRQIAERLGIARNTVRRYLSTPETILPTPRRRRASKLDAYTAYIDRRISEGLENCVVLRRVKGGEKLGQVVSTLRDSVRLSVKGKCPLCRLPC